MFVSHPYFLLANVSNIQDMYKLMNVVFIVVDSL